METNGFPNDEHDDDFDLAQFDDDFACVVVEASLRDVLEGNLGKGAHPNAVFGAAISICVDWGIPVYFCGDRQTARRFTEDYLERCWRAITNASLGDANA